MAEDDTGNTTPFTGGGNQQKQSLTPAQRAKNVLGNIKGESIKAIEGQYKNKVKGLIDKRLELTKAMTENDQQILDAEEEFENQLKALDSF